MIKPIALGLVTLALAGSRAEAQAPLRSVRRTIPIERSFQAGLAAGTRDSTGRPGRNYWQLRTDYRIDARLDPATATVSGRETVTIANPSDSALRQVVVRLYQNLFAPDVARSAPVVDITGGIKVTRLVVNGEAVNTDSAGDAWSHTTLARVRLMTPIPAHGSATLEAEWSFRVPDVPEKRRGDRMGRWGTRLFQVAQWYPQVAKYDDLRGWDMEPHLGGAEFYNNFGSFDVRIEVPAGWLVGATGVLANPEEVLSPTVRERLSRVESGDSQVVIVGPEERGAGQATATGDRLVWHFTADSVNDFAWATSNEFEWDATRATIPGRGPIPVNILYLPEHAGYHDAGARARHALEFYSALWMPYAFPQLTQVDGPEGGMEYPMLIMSGAGFGVTDHETGHQWWPMMVGTNETQYGWMDEGFNQYMNILSGAAFNHRPARLDSVAAQYGRIAGTDGQGPMMWDANYAGPWYGFVTYGKAPMMLAMLGAIVGDSAVQRAMSAYATTWRFRHPSPWDFMFAMDRELGRNLDWFWYYWLFTTESVDGSIASVETRGRKTRVTVREDGEMPSPVILKVEFVPGGPAPRPMKNAVIDGDSAIVTWPADVWFAGNRTFVAELDFGGRRIERITLDPGARFPDRNPGDNSWPRESP